MERRTTYVIGLLLAGMSREASAEGVTDRESARCHEVSVETGATAAIGPGPLRRIIFLQRQGGIYTPGSDDASANRSALLSATAQLPAWSAGDIAWANLVACVEQAYAAFDAVITEDDPGTAAHIEAVVSGLPSDIGLPPDVQGAAPLREDCAVNERAVVFVFAETLAGDGAELCATAVQETAHALGLDHELLCADPMSYLGGCGVKSFQDVAAPCGEDAARPCRCGAETQNSVATLLQVLGSSDRLGPAIALREPQPGATVEAGFLVEAWVSQGEEVAGVQLFIDGVVAQQRSEPPWQFSTPVEISPGPHQLRVRAFDAADNVGSADAIVTVVACSDCDRTAPGFVGGCALGHATRGSGPDLVMLAVLATTPFVILRRFRRADVKPEGKRRIV